VTNLHNSDEFETALDAAGIAGLVPVGFAEGATSVDGFYGFLQDAYSQEAGTIAVPDSGSSGAAELACNSREVVTADPRPTVLLKPDAPVQAQLNSSGIMYATVGWFAAVDGRYGQVANCMKEDNTSVEPSEIRKKKKHAATTHASHSYSYILRWLDDGTQSEWITADRLQSIVGSREALTERAAAETTQFTTDIIISTPGRYTSDLRVQLTLPLASQASAVTAEARQSIGLRTLRREMEDKMATQRAEYLGNERESRSLIQASAAAIHGLQQQLDAMRREQSMSDELRRELEVLRRWHVQSSVYGTNGTFYGQSSLLPCSRDHPGVARSLTFAALQLALPQISDAGINALHEAGLTNWGHILSTEVAALAKVLGEADAAALDQMLHPVR
jgi:hypothetical protein